MASCSWCKYYLNLVYPYFDGYACYDEYGYILRGVVCCSINCCLALVDSDNKKSNYVIEKRIDYIYKKYDIRGFVNSSKNPNRLIVNGGDLSYDEYRNEFQCPNPDDLNKSKNSPIRVSEEEEYNYYEYEPSEDNENYEEAVQNKEDCNDDNFDID